MVDDIFTNEQYHEFDKENGTYTMRDENSIYFEVDGPYQDLIHIEIFFRRIKILKRCTLRERH